MMLRAGAAIAVATLLAGCSQFNMAPACSDTASGVRVNLLGGIEQGATIDQARLQQIVAVSEPVEIGSAYNERTCSARAGISGEAALSINYRVQQSEGLRDWYGVEFLNASDPALHELAARVRTLYHQGG